MGILRKLLVGLVIPMAIIGGNIAQAASTPDEQFMVKNPPTNDRYTGINLADDNFGKNALSSLEAMTATGKSGDSTITSRTKCLEVGVPGCESNKYFQYNALLGMCDSQLTTDCVTKVFARDENGLEHEGQFLENFPGKTDYTFLGNPSIGLPTGASSFIVDFPKLPHNGGTQYLVLVYMQGAKNFDDSKFHLEGFNSGIYAVSKVDSRCNIPKPELNLRADLKLRGRSISQGSCNNGDSWDMRLPCAQTSKTSCAMPWTMPLNVTFGYSLKLHTKIQGWLHGRLTDAVAEINSMPDGDQLLTIQGKPSIVPGIHAWFKKGDYPTVLATYYAGIPTELVDSNGAGWGSNDGKSGNGPDGLPYSILKEGFGYNDDSFKEVLAWISATGDKATYAPSVWSIRAMLSGEFESCMKGSEGLSGIVSTNSTMYIGAPPTFDKESQSLDYKVMSPHSLPNGGEFKGSYDLVIKSDVARCIYGFSSAPVSAKISILSADGTTQVATTTFNERNGWMYLVARGFTFSSPTVRVKLTQESAKAPTTAAPKKLTITCVKGKSSKKVSAIKPVCPSGWKKK